MKVDVYKVDVVKYPLVNYKTSAPSTIQEQDVFKTQLQESRHVLWLLSDDLSFETAKALLKNRTGLKVKVIEKTHLAVQKLGRHHGIIHNNV